MLGKKVAAYRDSQGQAHVLSDTCVHRGGATKAGESTFKPCGNEPATVAYTIPSPARRESGNRVLDSIPLVASK